jgi:hypothetical protein
VKLIAHLHLVPTLRMCGAMPPPSSTSSWHLFLYFIFCHPRWVSLFLLSWETERSKRGIEKIVVYVAHLVWAEAGNFSLQHRVPTGSAPPPPSSYPMGTRSSFPGGKAAGVWSWPLTSIWCRGQRKRGYVPPIPEYVFVAWCLVKYRDNFTFTFT